MPPVNESQVSLSSDPPSQKNRRSRTGFKNLSLWLGLMASALVSAALWFLTVHAVRPLPPLTQDTTACDITPHFVMGGSQHPDDVILPAADRVEFPSNGWVVARPCGPATLTMQAYPTLALGQGPVLHVIQNNRLIYRRELREPQKIHLNLPQGGHTVMAVFNNVYDSDARAIAMHTIEIQGAGCPPVEVGTAQPGQTPTNIQAIKDPTTEVSLGSGFMVLDPHCQGLLTFEMRGRKGGGQLPRIRFTHAGKVEERDIPEGWHSYSFPLQGPLTLTLLNPYSHVNYYRHLNLDQITLRPKQ